MLFEQPQEDFGSLPKTREDDLLKVGSTWDVINPSFKVL